jgi:hypothetical protein
MGTTKTKTQFAKLLTELVNAKIRRDLGYDSMLRDTNVLLSFDMNCRKLVLEIKFDESLTVHV